MLKQLAVTLAAVGLALTGMAQERGVKIVEGDLPGEAEFEALRSLEDLKDRDVVLLDLTMLPLAWPSVMNDEGIYSTPQTCDFGMMEDVDRISVPTGSNHLLMDVRLGDPETHAANGLSCEYSPFFEKDASQWARMRLTGCYLVRSVSIPTAIQFVLNPLPASACGLHQ